MGAEKAAKVDAMHHGKKKWKSKAAEVKYKAANGLDKNGKKFKTKEAEQAAKTAALHHGDKKKWKSKAAEVEYKASRGLGKSKKHFENTAAEVEYKAQHVLGSKNKWKTADKEQATKVDAMS